jgi:IS605 OrfB family transposase
MELIPETDDAIIMEDLNISRMMNNYNLSRSVRDAEWHLFITMLKIKRLSMGKNIIEIRRFDTLSRMRSYWGYIYNLKPNERYCI